MITSSGCDAHNNLSLVADSFVQDTFFGVSGFLYTQSRLNSYNTISSGTRTATIMVDHVR